MGQVEVLEVLIANNEWVCSKDIHKTIKSMSYIAVCRALERLHIHNEIDRRKCQEKAHGYEYKFKRD